MRDGKRRMENINIIYLEGDHVRFWGFESLGPWFKFAYTLSGFYMTKSWEGNPRAIKMESGGYCDDAELVKLLHQQEIDFGLMTRVGDDLYAGIIQPRKDFTLEDLVRQHRLWKEESRIKR